MKQFFKKIFLSALTIQVLMAGAQLVYAEASINPGDIRWDFATDAEGFLPKDEKTTIEATEEGTIKVINNGDRDPNIYVEGLNLDPNVHKYLRFRMKNNSKSWLGEAYIYAGTITNRIKLSGFNIDNITGEWKEYCVPIDYSVMVNGTAHDYYTGFRLDYINAYDYGDVEIDYIVFSKSDAPITDSVIESIEIGGMEVVEFDSQGDYCETEVYEDIYKDLSEGSIEVFFAEEFSDADKYIAIKEVEDRKIIDITAVQDEMIRSYRISCKPIQRPAFIAVDSCEINGKYISFSGSVSDENGNPLQRPVTVIAHKKGEDIDIDTAKYIRVLLPDSEGNFSRTVKISDSEISAEFYTMELLFDVAGASEPVTAEVVYINETKCNESLKLMKESSLEVFEFMTTDDFEPVFDRMNVWIDLYSEQSDSVKKKINTAIDSYRTSLTIENIAEIANGTILAVIADEDNMLDMITEFDKNVKAVKIQDTLFGDLNSSSAQWVADIVIENGPFKTYEKFYNKIRESMFLEMVNNAKYMELCDLLLGNTDVLNDDMLKLKEQTDEDIIDEAMRLVVLEAKRKNFTSSENLVDAVNEALDSAAKDEKDNESSGNRGGNGSGGRGGSTKVEYVAPVQIITNNNKDVDTQQSKVFNDLEGYEWAEPAITKLHSAGIVNGTGNGNFEPERLVTREEFVKLMCEAFNVEESDMELTFSDVKADDWFYGYVSRAVNAKIVMGFSEDMFGTGANISREDMTVMLYRALKATGKSMDNVQNEFNDKNMIADYAKESVDTMTAHGIINGVGNNMFAPEKSATRAEAAVVILRCIEEFAM